MFKFGNIKVLVVDVDGCLTDGIYQISEQEMGKSLVTKSFYTRDFFGIENILKAGIEVIIISQSHDQVIQRQIDRISAYSGIWKNHLQCGSLRVLVGIDNKEEAIYSEILRGDNVWGCVAYFGDAENDIECMKLAGYTGCPDDALESIKEEVNYKSDYPGGKGAVCDFCMYIIKNRETENR